MILKPPATPRPGIGEELRTLTMASLTRFLYSGMQPGHDVIGVQSQGLQIENRCDSGPMTGRFSRPVSSWGAHKSASCLLEIVRFRRLVPLSLFSSVSTTSLPLLVEHAEMEHIIHGGHDVQIIARRRDLTHVLQAAASIVVQTRRGASACRTCPRESAWATPSCRRAIRGASARRTARGR